MLYIFLFGDYKSIFFNQSNSTKDHQNCRKSHINDFWKWDAWIWIPKIKEKVNMCFHPEIALDELSFCLVAYPSGQGHLKGGHGTSLTATTIYLKQLLVGSAVEQADLNNSDKKIYKLKSHKHWQGIIFPKYLLN